jgi:hypothetical protein
MCGSVEQVHALNISSTQAGAAAERALQFDQS